MSYWFYSMCLSFEPPFHLLNTLRTKKRITRNITQIFTIKQRANSQQSRYNSNTYFHTSTTGNKWRKIKQHNGKRWRKTYAKSISLYQTHHGKERQTIKQTVNKTFRDILCVCLAIYPYTFTITILQQNDKKNIFFGTKSNTQIKSSWNIIMKWELNMNLKLDYLHKKKSHFSSHLYANFEQIKK